MDKYVRRSDDYFPFIYYLSIYLSTYYLKCECINFALVIRRYIIQYIIIYIYVYNMHNNII